MAELPWHTRPRHPLGHWPTALEPLPRLTAELGGPAVWVKRDDCSGLAVGGNKTRKLEFLLGAALREEADTLVTFGAVQSNHARQTAAACARAGLNCHLILSRTVASDHPAYERSGNVLLDNLLGAQPHIVDVADAAGYAETLIAELEAAGRRVYVVPAGGSSALGALGYAVCAEEMLAQCRDLGFTPTIVMHASSSAGTQAGLLYGFGHLGSDAQVLGINVYHDDPVRLQQRVQRLHEEMQAQYGAHGKHPEVHVNHAYLGAGYGQPSAECVAAIRMAAGLEGLLFDPVYSGKALTALIDQVTLGNLDRHDNVILIHTGGSPALFVYDQVF